MGLHDGRVNWPLFFGCILIAFGPLTAIFFSVVAQRAQLVILALSGAFLWMISILMTATVWQVIPPVKDSLEATIVIGVVFQELSRYAFYVMYTRTERAVQKVTTPTHQLPLNDITSSLAGGVGFAFMHSLMMYGSMIASSTGSRGAAFSDACPAVPSVFASAFSTLAITLLEVALMVLAFDGYRKQHMVSIASVWILHMGVGLSALANKMDNGCTISIPIHFAGAVLAIGGASMVISRWKSLTPSAN